MGIKAGRDHDKVRLKSPQRGENVVVKGFKERIPLRSRGKGDIHNGSVRPRFVGSPCAWIKWSLVGRGVEDVRVAPKNILCAIAVVYIPINYADTLQSVVFPCMHGPYGDIIKQAKSTGCMTSCVVARGTHSDECIAALSCHDSIYGVTHAPRSP